MATMTKESGTTQDTMGIPNDIVRFYIWAEESSRWQIEMVEWAKSLPSEIKDANGVALADKVPPPPPRWP